MKTEYLIRSENSIQNLKLLVAYQKLEDLFDALDKKEMDEEHLLFINSEIKLLNLFAGSDKDLIKHLKKSYTRILSFIEKELKLVRKHHYQNKWMVFGMVGGVFISYLFKAIDYSATWNSIGFAISMGLIAGLLAGKNRDKKAKSLGQQLELNY